MGRERKKLEDLRQALKTAKAQKDEIWATLERLRGKIESTLEAGKFLKILLPVTLTRDT